MNKKNLFHTIMFLSISLFIGIFSSMAIEKVMNEFIKSLLIYLPTLHFIMVLINVSLFAGLYFISNLNKSKFIGNEREIETDQNKVLFEKMFRQMFMLKITAIENENKNIIKYYLAINLLLAIGSKIFTVDQYLILNMAFNFSAFVYSFMIMFQMIFKCYKISFLFNIIEKSLMQSIVDIEEKKMLYSLFTKNMSDFREKIIREMVGRSNE